MAAVEYNPAVVVVVVVPYIILPVTINMYKYTARGIPDIIISARGHGMENKTRLLKANRYCSGSLKDSHLSN